MSEPRKYIITLPSYFKPTLRMLPEYRNWSAIKSRCTNRKFDKKKRYVWRGIKMCDRWRIGERGVSGFECFLADMGLRPGEKFSVERIDNDGDYDPSNCKWATNKEQSNNRSSNHKLTFKGVTLSMMDMAEKYGISYFTLRDRVMRGWPIDQAIENPFGKSWRERVPARGCKLPHSVFTEDDVRAIRKERAEQGTPLSVFCRRYNVTKGAVSMMVNRKTWVHVA